MNTEERIRKQKELIEEMGRYFDKEGFQPIAGRILGLLMVMDKEQFTFEEITEELQISKSSASNTLKNLEIRGDIEYVTLPGKRKRYFQIQRRERNRVFEDIEKKMNEMVKLTELILELKADKNSKNSVYMQEMQATIKYLLSLMQKTKENFENNK